MKNVAQNLYHRAIAHSYHLNQTCELAAEAIELTLEDIEAVEKENRQLLDQHDALMVHIRKSQKELKQLRKQERTFRNGVRLMSAEDTICDWYATAYESVKRSPRGSKRIMQSLRRKCRVGGLS